MKLTKRRISMIALSLLILVSGILAGNQPVKSQSTNSYNNSNNGFELVDKAGNIRKPADVRDLYQLLGTYTPADPNGDTEMHVTYASPARLSITERTESSPMEPYW